MTQYGRADFFIFNKDKEILGMIVTIKIMFDYGAYPVWHKYDNGIYKNGLPNELRNTDKITEIFDEINNIYTNLFIDNEIEFSYRGFNSKADKKYFLELLLKGIEQLKTACGDSFILFNETFPENF